eukprot:3892297-Amphidinium_carterae.1
MSPVRVMVCYERPAVGLVVQCIFTLVSWASQGSKEGKKKPAKLPAEPPTMYFSISDPTNADDERQAQSKDIRRTCEERSS